MQDFELPDGSILETRINPADTNGSRPEDKWEYAAGVEWKTHFDLANAKTFKGVFANQNVVCKLSDPETVRFVREQFDIPAEIGQV
jgi:hypothetical protein